MMQEMKLSNRTIRLPSPSTQDESQHPKTIIAAPNHSTVGDIAMLVEPHGCQFSAISRGNLQFGHGKFAWPGRFFASMQSTLMLLCVSMRYDLTLPQEQTG